MHHGAGLCRLTKETELFKQLQRDYRQAPISANDRDMLEYAVKLTKTPWEITRQDVDKLCQAGFMDSAILDINQITAYFNFVNRLADGLGVELEAYWKNQEMT